MFDSIGKAGNSAARSACGRGCPSADASAHQDKRALHLARAGDSFAPMDPHLADRHVVTRPPNGARLWNIGRKQPAAPLPSRCARTHACRFQVWY